MMVSARNRASGLFSQHLHPQVGGYAAAQEFLGGFAEGLRCISVYLICLEYFRDKMRKQFEMEQQLCGMTDEEIRAMFKDDWKGTEK